MMIGDREPDLIRITPTPVHKMTDENIPHSAPPSANDHVSEITCRAVFERAATGIFVANPQGRYIEVNPRGCEMLGYSRDEILTMHIQDLITPEDQAAQPLHLAEVSAGQAITSERLLRCKNGEQLPVEISSSLLPDGSFLGIVRDLRQRKKAEEALRKSEERYRFLFENNPHPMWVYDRATLAFLAVNDSAVRKYGYSRAEFLRMTIADIRPAEDLHRLQEDLAQQRPDIQHTSSWRHTLKDGRIIDVDIHSHTLNFDGKDAVLVTAQDVTERRQMEEAMRTLNAELEQRIAERTRNLHENMQFVQLILANTASGIVVYDETGQCVMANEATAAIIGATKEQVLAQNFHDIPSWKNSRLYEFALAALNGDQMQQADMHVVTSFGKEIWVNCRFTAFASGGQPHLLLTLNDITERLQHEDEVEQLNHVLQAHAARLEAANQELEAFSYSISHDLRAPLRIIDGYTRLLLEEHGQQLDGEGQRFGRTIRENTRRMGQLIEDLLAFSRVGRVDMARTNIDMEALAQAVFEELTTPTERQRIDFAVAHLPPAQGDPRLMHQVWGNLIANAVKFSARRPHPKIEIDYQMTAAEQIYLVRDNGAGFDMNYAHKLFGVFQRLHSSEEYEGTGAGLAIVQRIIHRHGGRVWAEGTPDQGATFYFALPLRL